MPETYTTANEAKDEIVKAIASSTSISQDLRKRVNAEYDVDAIFNRTYAWDLKRKVFYSLIDPKAFWTVVERHAR